MKVVSGIARNVRNSTMVSGGGQDSSASTSHISLFRFQKQQIGLHFQSVIAIDEGDKVIVAGEVDKNKFNGYAYRNYTTGVEDSRGLFFPFLFGVIFFGVTLAILFFGFNEQKGLAILGSIIPGFFSFYMFRGYLKIQEARSCLRQLEDTDIKFE